MNTQIFTIDRENIDIDKIKIASKILKDGGLVAFPTETVYGLGANALLDTSVKNTFLAKGRPSDNPLIIHINDKKDIFKIAREMSPMAEKLIDAFSPGPFTIILKKQPYLSNSVTAGLDTVAIRIPSHPISRALIEYSNVPISAPSANLSGKPSPTEARHVIDDLKGKIDCIIDGGSCDVGVESTVVDATGEFPIILRPGGITFEDIKKVVSTVQIDTHVLNAVSVSDTPKSPGMKYKHYSPNADVTVIEGHKNDVQKKIYELLELSKGDSKKVGVLTMFDNSYNADCVLSAGMTNKEYAKNLFTRLREFDEFGIDIVYAEFCEQDGFGLAVKNRLYKSAGNKIIRV